MCSNSDILEMREAERERDVVCARARALGVKCQPSETMRALAGMRRRAGGSERGRGNAGEDGAQRATEKETDHR